LLCPFSFDGTLRKPGQIQLIDLLMSANYLYIHLMDSIGSLLFSGLIPERIHPPPREGKEEENFLTVKMPTRYCPDNPSRQSASRLPSFREPRLFSTILCEGVKRMIDSLLSGTVIVLLLGSFSSRGLALGVPVAQAKPAYPAPQKPIPKPVGKVKELVQQATALIDKDRTEEAIPLLHEAISLAPSDVQAHYFLGYALWKQSHQEAAAVEFRKVLELDTKHVLAQYFLARIAQAKGEWIRSARLYESIVGSGQIVYDTYLQLSQVYLRQGQTAKALQVLQKAVLESPLDGSLQYRLGQVYKQMGQLENARRSLETAERLKQADQKSIQKTLDLSMAIQNKQQDQVMRIREELLKESSQDPDILMQVGVLLGSGGYYEPSLEPLRIVAKMLDSSFEAHFNLGLSLLQLGQTQQAEAALKRAVEIRPESFEANSTLAVLFVNQNQTDEAIKRLRVARLARPENVKVMAMLGQQYLQGRYLQEAIETLSEAVRLKPEDPMLRSLLTSAYQKDKQFDKGLAIAKESLKLFPSNAQIHFEAGELWASLGRYQEAKSYYIEAIRMNPSFADAYCSLGDSLVRNGEYQAAFENFLAARSLDDRNLRAARGVGQSLNRLQRYSEAVAELEKAMRFFPEDSQLFFELSQAYTRLGNQAKAKEAVDAFEQLRAKETKAKDAERPRQFVTEEEKPEKK
jgi:tetratricopeptide (TPR) repeat protein